jgi:hypothetical protein
MEAVERRAISAKTYLLALLVAGSLSACSPYVYKTEINAFGTSVETMSSSHAGALSEAQRLRLAERRRDWIARNAALASTGPCVPPPEGVTFEFPENAVCELYEVGAQPSEPSATEAAARLAVDTANGLSAYAGALKAITNAEDRSTLDAATGELTSAIAGLSGESNAPRVSAAGGLLGSLFGAYLDRRRLNALRSGVTAAQPLVRTLAPELGASLNVLRSEQIRQHANRIQTLLNEINHRPANAPDAFYDVRLTEMESEVRTLEELRRSDPTATAQKLVEAHEALAEALADNSRQSEAVIAAIEAFAEEAQKLGEAFD